MDEIKNEVWAVVELMGHDVTAGVMKPTDIGGVVRIDVPIDDSFRTEYIGQGAIFRIRIVSEEIARAYAGPERGVIAYDEPIVPRAEYEKVLQRARNENNQLLHKIEILSRRLTDINSLPEPEKEDFNNE